MMNIYKNKNEENYYKFIQHIYKNKLSENDIKCKQTERKMKNKTYKLKKIKFEKIEGINSIVLGITTYNRKKFLIELINSFIKTKNYRYKWYLIIADDGSTDGTLEYLEKLFVPNVDTIIIKNNRDHISRQTNSILEVCQYLDYDYGFMANDDIVFKDYHWENDYISASKENELDHLVYFNSSGCSKLMKKKKFMSIKKNKIIADIDAYNCMGCFWTFTPKMIQTVGFFREDIFKGSGYSHQEFTLRSCAFGFNDIGALFDIIDSNKKIQLKCSSNDETYYSVKTNEHNSFNRRVFSHYKMLYETLDIEKFTIEEKGKIVTLNNNFGTNPFIYNCNKNKKFDLINKLTINKNNINPLFLERNIFQLCTSASLKHIHKRFCEIYGITDYVNSKESCLFFGVYDKFDINRIKNHNGRVYILWDDTDGGFKNSLKILSIIKRLDVYMHFSSSRNLYDRLIENGIVNEQIYFCLADLKIFKPIKEVKDNIFIYNGFKKNEEHIYGENIYKEVVKRLPEYEYIYSNCLNIGNKKMLDIYRKCFIGLVLTENHGNINVVQEMGFMNLPVIHNCDYKNCDYKNCIQWKTVDDIELSIRYRNIDNFVKEYQHCKNILFICNDYPGWGGAATNTYELIKFFQKRKFKVDGVFCTDSHVVNNFGENIKLFKQKYLKYYLQEKKNYYDLIILKNYVNINIKKICNNSTLLFFVPGIFRPHLDIHYSKINSKEVFDKYINENIIKTIKVCDKTYIASEYTKNILNKFYDLKTNILFINHIPFYNKKYNINAEFKFRKYDIGIIVSDFTRSIKNIGELINKILYLSKTHKFILIGKNSDIYKDEIDGKFLDILPHCQIKDYMTQIKIILNNSFYEACSNVLIEAKYAGCKIVSNFEYDTFLDYDDMINKIKKILMD